MTDKIAFDLVSPERLLLSEDAEMVTIPGTEGDMGVMAGHMPLVSTLRPGVISVSGGSKADERYYVMGGFAEIGASKITVLAEEAVPVSELDAAELDQRLIEAEKALGATASEVERAEAQAAVDRIKNLRSVV